MFSLFIVAWGKRSLSVVWSGCKSFKFILQKHEGCQRFSTGENEQHESIQRGFFLQAWPCIVLQDFGCTVIGNVLPDNSYHSCLSETGTLMACGDGCLKFSGEVCCWLRLCRPEITSAPGCIPRRREHGTVVEVPTWLPSVVRSSKCTGQPREFSHEEAVMEGDCGLALTLKRQTYEQKKALILNLTMMATLWFVKHWMPKVKMQAESL